MHYCLPFLYNDDDDDDHTSGWGKEICEVGFANISQKGFSIYQDHHTMQRSLLFQLKQLKRLLTSIKVVFFGKRMLTVTLKIKLIIHEDIKHEF